MIVGGGVQAGIAAAARAVRDAWSSEGRDGEPRLMDGVAGEEVAGQIASSVAVSEEMVQQYLSDPRQVELLAAAAGM